MGSSAAIAAILALAPLLYHPNSLSSSRIEVRGAEARLTIRCQIPSLAEVIDGLDGDGDGIVTEEEAAAKHDALLSYVGRHYVLRTGTARDGTGGHRLEPEPVDVRHASAGVDEGITYRGGSIDVTLRFVADRAIHDLAVEMTLFRETSPDHVDLVTIDWNGASIATAGLDHREPSLRSDPEGRGAFAAYLRLGFEHILGGWDHLAFLLALILASRRLGSLLAVVTAFTIAHSVTLALSVLGVVDLSAHVPLIEMAIALSIAYVAADTLLHPTARRSRWLEAFGFGLLHGLGFASFLGASLVHEAARAVALLAFNIGVEIGQVLVAVAAVAVLRMLARTRLLRPNDPDEDAFLAPRTVRVAGSAIILLLGLIWFAERLP